MSDKGWYKSFKNIFSSKKVQPVVPQNPQNKVIPRKVNFPNVTAEKPQIKPPSSIGTVEEKTLSQQIVNQRIKNQTQQFQQISKEIIQQPENKVDERYDRIDCKYTFKQLQFTKDDILPGQIIVLYQKKNVEFKIRKNFYIEGEFILTNYKFVFKPAYKEFVNQRSDYLKVPLGLVQKIDRKNDNNRKKQSLPKLVIRLKDTREFKFRIPSLDILKKVSDELTKFSFVTQKRYFFAFRYFEYNKQLEQKYQGWKIYNPYKEFQRMKLKIMEHSQKSITQFTSDYKYLDNKDGKICTTYPSVLVVPSRLHYEYIVRCSKFRSRQRLPVLSYAYQYQSSKFSTLFRCSQNKLGVSRNRCLQDQLMLRMIGDPKTQIKEQFKGAPNCKIYDARGYYAALGNVFGGKGYELPEFYKNCQIQWLDIPNIHSVRQSYLKLKQAALGDETKYLSILAQSNWYDNIFLIINGARQIASSLAKGINCVCHCSDGWDRTAQLCALAAMILDPYYRTIQGFQVLIEKQWISFGHQFCERFGQGSSEHASEQKAPIFLQFLDCVTQLMDQFPLSFQFNFKFITQISKQIFLHIYGNFLCDSQLQQIRTSIFKKTVSLWSYLKQNRQQYINTYYQSNWLKCLDVSPAQKNMRFWKQHFMYYTQGFKDVYSIYSCEWTDENTSIIHSQIRKQNELLRDKHIQNESIIKNLMNEIQVAKKQSRQ